MGIFSSVVSGLSSIVSGAARIGGAIASTVATVAPVLKPLIEKMHPVGRAVVGVLEVVGHTLNIFKAGESVSYIGDRALQAAEQDERLVPDNFDDYNQYLDEIRSIELDPIKTEKNTKDGSALITGLATVAVGLEKIYDLKEGASADLLKAVISDPEFFDANRLKVLVSENADFGAIANYIEGKLGNTDTGALYDKLFVIEKKHNPAAQQGAFEDALYDVKAKAAATIEEAKGGAE